MKFIKLFKYVCTNLFVFQKALSANDMKSWIQSINEQSGKKNDGSINVNEELILKKKKELENYSSLVNIFYHFLPTFA